MSGEGVIHFQAIRYPELLGIDVLTDDEYDATSMKPHEILWEGTADSAEDALDLCIEKNQKRFLSACERANRCR